MNNNNKYDLNKIQSELTAVKVLVAILESQGSVRVPVSKLADATNKDKELLVDFDSESQEFIFRSFKITGDIQSILIDENVLKGEQIEQ